MKDKRGQQLTLGTIILIILGLAVLILLIFGFTQGWNNLWDKITGYTTGSNVEDVKLDCQNDCNSGETSSFCNERKTLRVVDSNGDTVKVKATCNQLRGSKDIDPLKAAQIQALGFTSCQSIPVGDCETTSSS